MQQHVKPDINLSPDMEKLVDEAVSSGEYGSASDVIDAALRSWSELRDNFGYTLDELRNLVDEGIAGGPGRFSSIEEIKAEARRRRAT